MMRQKRYNTLWQRFLNFIFPNRAATKQQQREIERRMWEIDYLVFCQMAALMSRYRLKS